MKETAINAREATPILFPYDPKIFWDLLRRIVREEVCALEKQAPGGISLKEIDLSYKPLYKMDDLCKIFQVSKPTIYDWVKRGKLNPFKIRSRVYFLKRDIDQMLSAL